MKAMDVRSEPYRLFFPLALLLGGAGVGHWLLYVSGLQAGYSGQAHALIQVQAFLMAIAAGFLMTMIPRRTGSAPASTLQVGVVAVALVAGAVAALADAWWWAEGAFVLVMIVLSVFAISRLARGESRPPAAFVLIPIGLAQAAVGAVLIALASPAVLGIGRGLVQEGLFLCLILGTGHLVMPLISGHGPAAGKPTGAALAAHVTAGLVIAASFPVQHLIGASHGLDAGTRWGCGLRAAVLLIEGFGCMAAWRWPVSPGLHRRMAWLAFWMVPAGEVLAATMPRHRVGLLHVTFVGGFGLLALTVAAHVIAGHGAGTDVLERRPKAVAAFASLFLVAMSTRVTADFFARGYWTHVGAAAALWLLALVAWAIAFLPGIWRRPLRDVVSITVPGR